jgi:hypothetical protein
MMIESGGLHEEHKLAVGKKVSSIKRTKNKKCRSDTRPPSVMMIESGVLHEEHKLAVGKKVSSIKRTKNKNCPSVIRPPSVLTRPSWLISYPSCLHS